MAQTIPTMVDPATTYAARLQQAMRRAGHDPDSFGGARWLAGQLGVSYQAARKAIAGMTKMLAANNNARAAQALAVDPNWLATGDGAINWTPEQHSSEGVGARTVAHDLSLNRRDDAPVRIEWDRILKDPLKREFQTTMPDASMEPDIPRGAGIIFVTDLQAAPGDWVLIKDRDGNPFVRELRQVKPGRWQAHAMNPAFLPMDSEGDGLEVLAVFDGLRGRKARV